MASMKKSDCETQHYYVGATIDDRYELIDFIGVGGMACVYRAREQGAPLEFAIKFLKTEYHNMPYLVEYFEDEASSMRDLAHPNIVRFYRFVNRDEYSYIIMDYVDGFALSEVIKLSRKNKQYLPLDEVVRVMTQIARALDAIHREGFVHRDIKPSNVLIDRKTGQAFMTDLGITSTSNTVMEGAGTLAYMSPEQSETWVADVQSDIYSYGIVLFEMLAMVRPFRVTAGLRGKEAEADLLEKHKSAPIPKVTDIRNDLPSKLDTIIAKALAKNPAHRYNSVIEFASDVHQALSPMLSSDMQDFSSIQHRQIVAPDTRTASQPAQDNSMRMLIGIGIVAFILAILFAVGSFMNASDTPAEIADNPTSIIVPTITQTTAPTATFTPNPLEGAPVFPFINGAPAISVLSPTDDLTITASENDPLRYLRIGRVNGFRVEMTINTTENVERYGLAFRVQDPENYHYFTVNPMTSDWEIGTVNAGEASVAQTGTLTEPINRFIISGRENFFEIRSGAFVQNYVSNLYPQGSLALYLQNGTLSLDRLQVNLIGDEAIAAVRATPTQTNGIGDPFRLLRADINAMLATNNPGVNGVACPDYIMIYEMLERHLDSNNPNVRSVAQSAIDDGAFVYDTCRTESPDDTFSFTQDFQDYLDWESDLTSLRQQLP